MSTISFGHLGRYALSMAVCGALLGFGGGVAHAQAAAVEDDATAATLRDIVSGEEPGAPQNEDQVEAAVIDGFRSAKFGMTEAEVMQAIQDDFAVGEGDVIRDHNRLERTDSLIIRAESLLPDSGEAAVVYILGYSTHQLIQVNVIWGAPVAQDYDPAVLVQTANDLQRYFAGRRYAPDTAFANILLEDGTLIVFTGSDEEGRQVTLSLIRRPEETPAGEDESAEENTDEGGEEAAAEAPLIPVILRLSYVANPAEPDIFRVAPGTF